MSEGNTKNVVRLDERGLAYTVRILVRHPTEPLDCMTISTGVSPLLLQRKGDRRNIRGKALPGFFPHSAWSWWEEIRDSRDFGLGVARAVDILVPASECIARLRKSGGEVDVILDLHGERNIGAYIRTRELGRMAELGIDFGIEVFPHSND